MSTYNIPFSIYKENQLKSSQICSYQIFFQGTQRPSVFEPLKLYCIRETHSLPNVYHNVKVDITRLLVLGIDEFQLPGLS